MNQNYFFKKGISIRYDSAQKRDHAHAYSTRRRAESFLDLKAAGRAPPNIRRNKW